MHMTISLRLLPVASFVSKGRVRMFTHTRDFSFTLVLLRSHCPEKIHELVREYIYRNFAVSLAFICIIYLYRYTVRPL